VQLNDQGWQVWLLLTTRELVAYQPEWWPPPARILVDIDDDSIPPLDQATYEKVKNNEAMFPEDDYRTSSTGLPGFTKTAPRRCFDLAIEHGMTVWREKRVLWVDVPV